MSPHIDVVDWVGGFPFEVATPDEIFLFFFNRNYELIDLKLLVPLFMHMKKASQIR